MSLTKGFLSKKKTIPIHALISGGIFWVLYSYILYAFFQLTREALRIITKEMGDFDLLILTELETFLYNLFYAGISSAVGFTFALKLTFSVILQIISN